MLKKLSSATLGLLCVLSLAAPSWAETVMEKVARTGVLTVGTRFDLIPYSYINDKGELVGYSIDALNVIKEQLQKQLGKDITIQMVEAKDPGDRIAQLNTGDIDIACDTAFTWQRDQAVDFSVSYSISGIRLVTKQKSQIDGSPESLIGKRIGVGENTIAQDLIARVQPKAILVPGTVSVDEGFKLLDEGKVDAIAADSIILVGAAQRLGADNYKIVPDKAYANYGLACIVPENNSTFLNLVNYSLVKLMQGYVAEEKPYVEMVNRWFGPEGIVPVPADLIRSFFETIIIERAQIPPDSPSR
jgi:polar amino acid transport system substrate-binding protein